MSNTSIAQKTIDCVIKITVYHIAQVVTSRTVIITKTALLLVENSVGYIAVQSICGIENMFEFLTIGSLN